MPLDPETINNLINGDENEQSIEEARTLIDTGHCILFAGAGVSKDAGYPLWRELLDEMQRCLVHHGLADPRTNPGNLLTSADELYDCFRSNDLLDPDYYAFLYNRFAPKGGQSLDLQNTLLSAPFCGIATTNWDISFETAIRTWWPERAQSFRRFSIHQDHPNGVRDFFDSLWRGFPSISVAHLHGVYDFAKEIILTGVQYEMAYGGPHEQIGASQPAAMGGKWTFLRRTIWALMATQRLIFVGFGMNDPFLLALFQFVSGDLWDRTGKVHYLVTHVSPDMEQDPSSYRGRLRNKIGVQSVFYEVQGNDHSRLRDLLYKLGANPNVNRHDQPAVSELLGPI